MRWAGLTDFLPFLRKAVSEIYTRDYSTRRARTGYSPPPGYDGTVFSGDGMKMHAADTLVTDLDRGSADDEVCECEPAPVVESADNTECTTSVQERSTSNPLGDLVSSLRGKLGTEELILILVLLIVASEGIGIEALILGLLLISG